MELILVTVAVGITFPTWATSDYNYPSANASASIGWNFVECVLARCCVNAIFFFTSLSTLSINSDVIRFPSKSTSQLLDETYILKYLTKNHSHPSC